MLYIWCNNIPAAVEASISGANVGREGVNTFHICTCTCRLHIKVIFNQYDIKKNPY